jgi:hypothetical protein
VVEAVLVAEVVVVGQAAGALLVVAAQGVEVGLEEEVGPGAEEGLEEGAAALELSVGPDSVHVAGDSLVGAGRKRVAFFGSVDFTSLIYTHIQKCHLKTPRLS